MDFTAVPETGPTVCSANKEGQRIWAYIGMARSAPYMTVWAVEITDARCKQSSSILGDVKFEFEYALNTNCLKRSGCNEWVGTVSGVEEEMVQAISAERRYSGRPRIIEGGVRVVAL